MSLEVLPAGARLWLLASRSPLPPALEAAFAAGLGEILAAWRHKGVRYEGALEILEHRIVAIAEPLLASAPSGCAIDGMLRRVHRLAASLGVAFVDPSREVLLRLEGGLAVVDKGDLEARILAGALGPGTPVLDLGLYALGDLQAGRLERPLLDTWIGRRYRTILGAPAAS